jgi:hypothetical protein
MVHPSDKTSLRRSGFTLLETVFSAFLMTIVVGGALTLVFRSQIFVADEVQHYDLDQAGRHILLRLSDELRTALPSSVLPLVMTNSPTLSFQRPIGFDNSGNPILSPVITFALETPAEVDKTGKFLTYQEAGGTAIRLAGRVQALRFNRLPKGVTFDVDVGSKDRTGILVQKSFSQSVSHRY